MNQHVLAFKLDANLCSRPGGEEAPNALPQPSHREMPGMATLNVAPSECASCVLHSSPYTLPTPTQSCLEVQAKPRFSTQKGKKSKCGSSNPNSHGPILISG